MLIDSSVVSTKDMLGHVKILISIFISELNNEIKNFKPKTVVAMLLTGIAVDNYGLVRILFSLS